MLRTNVCHYETGLGTTLYTLVSLAMCRPLPTVTVIVKTSPLALLRVASPSLSTVMAAVAALVSDVQLPFVLAIVAVTVMLLPAAVVFQVHAFVAES